MSKYETEIDLSNTNTSHFHMLELVGHNKRVLDVGCASGYLARILVDRGCTVSGVEIDAEAAEHARPILDRLVVGDLERIDLTQEFEPSSFDVILFGDILEHLRDPLSPLAQAKKLLAPGGYVVISIPNIGHGAVRLALLEGKWNYGPLGLLDETHLRFFTRENLNELLYRAGLAAAEIRRTTAGLFETELGVRPEDYPKELIEKIEDDPEATTYQFVVRAVHDDADRSVAALAERLQSREDEVHTLRRELERERTERAADTARLEGRVAALENELDAVVNSTTWRWTRLPRALVTRLRRRK